MCGILAIVNKKKQSFTADKLTAAAAIIRHRGPDDEGFLTWTPGEKPEIWAGADTDASTIAYWNYKQIDPAKHFKVGFGHRRLSILDLSPLGHQPMLLPEAGLAITFNGEVYNYLEIKEELEKKGHMFKGTSDTEVILHAWQEWGVKCLDKFNGMFAIGILDYLKNEFYIVRDRFGVKPVFYYEGANAIYFASEIKQITTSPDYRFELNEQVTRHFLGTGVSDFTDETFYKGVKKLLPGHYLRIDLSKENIEVKRTKWYTLTPKKWNGTYDEAVVKLRELLIDAVRLRLRSDVTIGSCLSGGLDSSSIVCIAADLLKQKGDYVGQETVTSRYPYKEYDEWEFAQAVIDQTGVHPHTIYSTFEQLQQEIDTILWHQDGPGASMSLFSGWQVQKKTGEVGLKVMLNGQGADEHLAGYFSHDLPLYAGLMAKMKLGTLYSEARNYKKENGKWPVSFLLGALQINLGPMAKLMPAKLKYKGTGRTEWLHDPNNEVQYATPAHSLHEHLVKQIYMAPLPGIVRYEDHNAMAFGIESRTPFLDYRLVEFDLGLPEEYILRKSVRKTILRDAMHGIIPEKVEKRRDKMGFVAPEEKWIKGEGRAWFMESIDKACKQFDGQLLYAEKTKQYVTEVLDGKRPFDTVPWRLFCLQRWYDLQLKERA